MKNLLSMFRIRGLSQSRWVFIKEMHSFFGSNLPPVSFGIMAFLCGMVSVLISLTENATVDDITRALFYLFYIIIMTSSVFLGISSFVGEKRQNTMELLRTLPITDTELVIGKFLPGIVYVLIMAIGMTLVYIGGIADAPWYALLSGIAGLLLAGLYAYSAALLASSVSESYLTALMIAGAILIGIDLTGFLSGLLPSPASEILSTLHAVNHYMPFTRGVIPLRGTVFFISCIVLFLFLTVQILDSGRWRQNDS